MGEPHPAFHEASPDEELPVLLMRVGKLMLEQMRAQHEDKPPEARVLTITHGFVTRYLEHHDDVTTVELAQHLRVTKQSASEIVSALEAAGYVRRRPHPVDGRARIVELTAAGRRKLQISHERWRAAEAEWAAVAGGADLETVRRALEAYLAAI
jgi:DNA-binding MarR family transcriptional regulator